MLKKSFSLFLTISLSIAMILLTTGCSDKNTRIILQGESSHWKGEFDTSIHNNSNESGEYTFYYKDEDWKNVKEYHFNINDRIILKETGIANRTVNVPVTRKNSLVSTEETQTIIIKWNHSNGEQFEETLLLNSTDP